MKQDKTTKVTTETVRWQRLILSILLLFGLALRLSAQTPLVDYTGAVTKYDPSFRGIGPEVYFLPAPKTPQEELEDHYRDKKPFSKEIARQLFFQRILVQLKSTENIGQFSHLLHPFPKDQQTWQTVLDRELQHDNPIGAYAIANEAALAALKNRDTTQALAYLERALRYAATVGNKNNLSTLHFNLSQLCLYMERYAQAEEHAQQFHTYALSNKSYIDQAEAYLALALANAGQRNYKSAENNIIRKAIPLYNKSKAYARKIYAWEMLAEVYFQQNKFTEAQWFLLQARDLANAKQITTELAEIEYLLAASKLEDGNYKISKKEFIVADRLASAENNKPLNLAILDKLGEVYMQLNDYQAAREIYEQYKRLKAELYP